jgi:hypothetical protein
MRNADTDEIYARGASVLRVPVDGRARLMRMGAWGPIRLMQAALATAAEEPKWFRRRPRCTHCKRPCTGEAAPVDIALRVHEGDRELVLHLTTPGFHCPCGRRLCSLRAEVRELVEDLLVCCDFPSGAGPSYEALREARRQDVRRLQ